MKEEIFQKTGKSDLAFLPFLAIIEAKASKEGIL